MSTTNPQTSATGHRSPGRRRKERLQFLGGGAALAIVIVFAVVNLNDVKVDWIVTTTQTSLTVVIVVSFLVGAVSGAALWRQRSKP